MQSPAMQTSINENLLKRIRTATNDLHIQLEEQPLSKELLSEEVTFAVYIRYLSLMNEVHNFYENKILTALKINITSIDRVLKQKLIEDDLNYLRNEGH